MAHKKDSADVNCENMILFVTDGREGDNDLRCSPGGIIIDIVLLQYSRYAVCLATSVG